METTMRWLALSASLLVALAAHAGSPGEGSAGAKPGRGPVDANNDGIVTREEAGKYPRLAADFDAADANKDGQLDTAELQAHREKMRVEMRAKAEERWKAADTDGDGRLSLAEAQASMPKMAERFGTFDADKDGYVSRDEMHNFRMKTKRRE
jgi:Ca2+-binding EF-hand superfamily protein